MKHQKEYFWHFFTSIIFIILVIAAIIYLNNLNRLNIPISFFDFVVLSLAVFRLVRLFTYDKVMDFIRDYLDKYEKGFGKSLSELIHCPWCTGIWISLFTTFIYFLSPLSWFFIFILAIAGTGSIIQIILIYLGKIVKK
jgi:hypothetical protein